MRHLEFHSQLTAVPAVGRGCDNRVELQQALIDAVDLDGVTERSCGVHVGGAPHFCGYQIGHSRKPARLIVRHHGAVILGKKRDVMQSFFARAKAVTECRGAEAMLGDQFDLDIARLGMRRANLQRRRLTAVQYLVKRDVSADDEGPDPEQMMIAGYSFVQITHVVCVLHKVLALRRAERKLQDTSQFYIEIDASQRWTIMSSTLAMEIAPPDPAAVDVVLSLCGAWNKLDMDAIVGLLADDIIYHNIPLEPLAGKHEVEAYLRSAGPFESCRWELVAIAANGSTVLTERIDRFVVRGKPVTLPVSGTFEVENGRIREWRDYFDLANYRAQWPEMDAA